MSITEQITLGIIQGIVEWLPVSSEGVIVLVESKFFPSEQGFEFSVRKALFLHLGTFLAALIYFRKDVFHLCRSVARLRESSEETRQCVLFLFISTLISGILGLSLIKWIGQMDADFSSTQKSVTLLIGCLLLVTGFLQIKAQSGGIKNLHDLRPVEGIILGIVQGFAALPGLSRSGLTVSALLLRKFDDIYALKLSFLMSLPIVLVGNILYNFRSFEFFPLGLVALFFSFCFGMITIHLLLKLARKLKFGPFVLIFGFLTILSAFI